MRNGFLLLFLWVLVHSVIASEVLPPVNNVPLIHSTYDNDPHLRFEEADDVFSYAGVIGDHAWEVRLTCPLQEIVHHMAHQRYQDNLLVPPHGSDLVAAPSPGPATSLRKPLAETILAALLSQTLDAQSPTSNSLAQPDTAPGCSVPTDSCPSKSCLSPPRNSSIPSKLLDFYNQLPGTTPANIRHPEQQDQTPQYHDNTHFMSTVFVVSILINVVVVLCVVHHYGCKIIKRVTTPLPTPPSPPTVPPLTTLPPTNPALVPERRTSRSSRISSLEEPSELDYSGLNLVETTQYTHNSTVRTPTSTQSSSSSDFDPQTQMTPIVPIKSKFFASSCNSSPSNSVADSIAGGMRTFLFCDGRYESEFQQLKPLGNGGFGNVYECKNKLTGVRYAIKKVPVKVHRTGRQSEAYLCDGFALREVTIAAQLNHPNIVRYITAWLQDAPTDAIPACSSEMSLSTLSAVSTLRSSRQSVDDNRTVLFIQMELCEEGTLSCHLTRAQRPPSLAFAIRVLHQSLTAMDYIHASGIIHRDIKPSNMFWHKGVLKIGDFGCSRSSCSLPIAVTTSDDYMEFMLEEGDPDPSTLTSGVGTSVYAAPEQLSGSQYNTSCDVFSLGIVFFEMLHPTFSTASERAHVLTALRHGSVAKDVVQAFPTQAAVIRRMIAFDPNSRPLVSDLLEIVDEWINNGDHFETPPLNQPLLTSVMRVSSPALPRIGTDPPPRRARALSSPDIGPHIASPQILDAMRLLREQPMDLDDDDDDDASCEDSEEGSEEESGEEEETSMTAVLQLVSG